MNRNNKEKDGLIAFIITAIVSILIGAILILT
jgi:hypothetical protein